MMAIRLSSRLIRLFLAVGRVFSLGLAANLAGTPAWADECETQCNARYHQCNIGSAWAAERTCATQLKICQLACTSKGYGSIAYSKKTHGHGYALGHPSRLEAEGAAVKECEAHTPASQDCQPLIWFTGRCGALALGDGGAYGAAQHATQTEASKRAVELCAPHGEACRVVLELCSRSASSAP